MDRAKTIRTPQRARQARDIELLADEQCLNDSAGGPGISPGSRGSWAIFQFSWFCWAGNWFTAKLGEMDHPFCMGSPSFGALCCAGKWSHRSQDVQKTGCSLLISLPASVLPSSDTESPEPRRSSQNLVAPLQTMDPCGHSGVAYMLFYFSPDFHVKSVCVPGIPRFHLNLASPSPGGLLAPRLAPRVGG